MVIIPWSFCMIRATAEWTLNPIPFEFGTSNVTLSKDGTVTRILFMKCVACILLLSALTCSGLAQIVMPREQREDVAVWKPPLLLKFTDDSFSHPSVPKEMISSMLLSESRIVLEETRMDAIQAKFGGESGADGDASESLLWLCLHGSDETGPWVLWLESGEMNGPYIGEFRWQRVSNSASFDPRCAAQPAGTEIILPIDVKLGISQEEVLKVLGKPTWEKANILLYEHQHDEKIQGELFTSFNTVIIALRGGVVEAIDVMKTTSN
jgi:hypothetical protein